MSAETITIDAPLDSVEPESIQTDPLPSSPRHFFSGVRGKARTVKPAPAPRRRASKIDIKAGMIDLYTTLGFGIAMAPSKPSATDPTQSVTMVVGQSIVANAESCAIAWERLAKENPAIRMALERMLTVSAFGAVIMAHAPILIVAVQASGQALPAFPKPPSESTA